ncbi:hypothetical protein KUCAC02_029974 [Chaenocephalus aceratus]|uniref:Uncharacterized protein n=1 Tax=Chaenocephalus aceratus TaxID=36190 RepID=A0ACB9XJK9_CHAAC|nr:hypothetical protein KUCAC02_029974 [Chaenocephalus aceratus]
MSSRGGTPYIGSQISLISKAHIRYEGILSSVDIDRSTVALAKVRSYGTEDRRADRPVPPKDEMYEYIIFRGSDIQDITVSEPRKQHHGLPRDPAIVQSSMGSSLAVYHPRWSSYRDMMPTYNQLAATSLLNQQYNAALGLGLHGIPARRAPMVEQAVQTVPLAGAAQPEKGKGFYPATGQTACSTNTVLCPGSEGERTHQSDTISAKCSQETKAKTRQPEVEEPKQRPTSGENSKPTTLQFESDFDFETANAQFKDDLKKDVVVEKVDAEDSLVVQEEEDTQGEKYYDKAKCFFDNISTDLKPRRTTWEEEKKMNIETFGVPGRLLRGRGGRARRGQSTPEQRPLPKIVSGRL